MKLSAPNVAVSPAYAVTDVPVVVLFPVEVELNKVVLFVNQVVAGMLTASPLIAFTQVFCNVKLALLRVFVYVQTMFVSAPLMVKPSARFVSAAPVQVKVAV